MNSFVLYLSLILFISGARAKSSTTNDVSDQRTSSSIDFHQLTNADVLRERIREREWKDEELPCLNTILTALNESKNFTLWAVWLIDSIQLPIGQLYGSKYHIGNYDECMNPPWIDTHPELKTQYCVAELYLTRALKNKYGNILDPKGSAEVYFKTRTKHDTDLTKMIWGTCVPETCKPSAIIKIFRTLLKVSHLGYFSEEADISIASCEVAGTPFDLTKYVTHFLYALVVAFIIACLSTYYIRFYYNPEKKSYFQEAIRSFCFRRNINSLITTRDDEIYIINIMNVGTSVIITCGHLFFLLYPGMVVNGLDIEKDIDNGLGYLNQANLVMDTVFTISGLLLVRGFFNGNWTNPYNFLIKRYLSTISILGNMIYIKTWAFYHTSNGPVWPKLAGAERDMCMRTWWHTFTLTANYFTGSDMCYIKSWSFPVDFHMSIIGVVICCMYLKNKRLAMSMFWMLLAVGVFTSGWVYYYKELPALSFYGIESLGNPRENILLITTYVTTHTRPGPFLNGMVLGYILAHYNPNKYRNIISKKWSYLLIIMSLIVMGGITVVGYNLYLEPNRLGIAIFNSLNRNLWAIMIAVIIAACEYGNLGDLRVLINWSPLVPLSRLTMGVFFIHMALIERNVMSIRAPYRWDHLALIEEGLGILVISFAASFMSWVLVQAPVGNLASLVLDGIQNKSEEVTATPTSVEKLKTK